MIHASRATLSLLTPVLCVFVNRFWMILLSLTKVTLARSKSLARLVDKRSPYSPCALMASFTSSSTVCRSDTSVINTRNSSEACFRRRSLFNPLETVPAAVRTARMLAVKDKGSIVLNHFCRFNEKFSSTSVSSRKYFCLAASLK